MNTKKEITAAISAVMQYIKSQEEAAGFAGLDATEKQERYTTKAVNAWGMNGRQTQMQLRNLMQLRTFGRR